MEGVTDGENEGDDCDVKETVKEMICRSGVKGRGSDVSSSMATPEVT